MDIKQELVRISKTLNAGLLNHIVKSANQLIPF